jgi:energy-coupling factor transporter ATP-binding protein EcfA2
MRSPSLKRLVIKLDYLKNNLKNVYTLIKNPDALIKGLEDLDNIIGLEYVKEKISKFISTYIAERLMGTFIADENNIVITGPPGVGKTTIAEILSYIINSIGIIVWEKDTTNACYAGQGSDIMTNHMTCIAGIDTFIRDGGPVHTRRKSKSGIELTLDDTKKKNVMYSIHNQEIHDMIYITDMKLKELENKVEKGELDNEAIKKHVKDISYSYTCSIIGKINKFDSSNLSGKSNESKAPHVFPDFENKFIHASKSDLIGGFVGSTPIKTKKLLDCARGGVLFLDEAYSLININPETGSYGSDFGTEALTEICNDITKNPGSILFIFAGYKDKIMRNVFDVQDGLKRRFGCWIDIDGYNYQELYEIFGLMLEKKKIYIEDGDTSIRQFFEDNGKTFKNYAGDCKTLVKYTKELVYDKYFDDLTTPRIDNVMSMKNTDVRTTGKMYLREKDVRNAYKNMTLHINDDKDDRCIYNLIYN